MDLRHIPPSVQRLWADEVIYLHSLWHQGPPQNRTHGPNTNPNPNMGPVKSNEFKTKKKKKKRRNGKNNNQSQPSDPPGVEIEWPVNPTPDRDADPDSWPEPARNTHPRAPPSAVDEARASALRVHWDALQWCRDFFSKDGSDDDDAMSEDEDEDEEESKAFEFFLGVFENDWELRGYYEKNHEKGEFSCLVCVGTGVKLGKRYGDCVGLVQHSNAVSKTKRRGAHRGFGQAVCRVLGWNIERLPSIVLDTGKPLGQSLVKSAKMQEDMKIEDGTEIVAIPNVKCNNFLSLSPAGTNEEYVHKDDANVNLTDCIKANETEVPSEDGQKKACNEIVVIPDDDVHKDDNNGDLTDFIKANETGVPNGDRQKKDCIEIVVIPDDDVQKDDDNEDLADCMEANETEEPNKEGVGDGKEILSESGKHPEGRRKKKDNKKKHFIYTPYIPPAAKVVWPCEPSTSLKPDAPGWERLVQAPSTSQPRQPLSTNEQERATAIQVQQNALMACRNFLAKPDDSSSEEEEEEEEMEKRESVAFKFFLKLFERDRNLKNYYANNSLKGEFCCLVCGGIGKKTWKRFGDCVGLVQHSMSIFSTERRWAHRAFGRVVCEVLAWDINMNPGSIRHSKELQSQVLENSVKTQDDTCKDDKARC